MHSSLVTVQEFAWRRYVCWWKKARVIITGLRQANVDEAVRLITRSVTGVQGDIGNIGDLDRLFKLITEEKGRPYMVIANAAIQVSAPLGAI